MYLYKLLEKCKKNCWAWRIPNVTQTLFRLYPISHAAADAPICIECQALEMTFYDPNCQGCRVELERPNVGIPHVMAVLRQWVPQVTCRNFTSQTVWPDCQNLKVFGNIFRVYLVFGKFWNCFGKFCMPLGSFSLLLMNKYWKIIYPSCHTDHKVSY